MSYWLFLYNNNSYALKSVICLLVVVFRIYVTKKCLLTNIVYNLEEKMKKNTVNKVASEILKQTITKYIFWNKSAKKVKIKREIVIDEIIHFFERLDLYRSESTIRHQINAHRPINHDAVAGYAKWMMEKMKTSSTIVDMNRIKLFLDECEYKKPGKLIDIYLLANGNEYDFYQKIVTTNVPALNLHTSKFLGREKEIKSMCQWVDDNKTKIAVLYGFGGNGKTTLQTKLGHLFIHSPVSLPRYPFVGVVWVSDVDTTPLTLTRLMEIIGKTTHIAPKPEGVNPKYLKEKVMDILTTKRILILLDNFESIQPEQQAMILNFFMSTSGESKLIISTRQNLTAFSYLEIIQSKGFLHEHLPHHIQFIEGLKEKDVYQLIQSITNKNNMTISDENMTKLASVAEKNPKVILSVLGLVKNNDDLTLFIDNLSKDSRSEDVFKAVIDHTFISDNAAKETFLAKALFRCSVNKNKLGDMVDIHGEQLDEIISRLHAINLFGVDANNNYRINAHPLSQQYANRLLKDNTSISQKIVENFWQFYLPDVMEAIQKTSFEKLADDSSLSDDIINVTEFLISQIGSRSKYEIEALSTLGKRHGIGYFLTEIGHWDNAQRIAQKVLSVSQNHYSLENGLKIVLLGETIHQLVKINCFRGIPEQSIKYIGIAEEENADLNDNWLSARINLCHGHLRRELGQFKAARHYYKRCIEQLENLPQTNENVRILSEAYRYMGGIVIDLANRELDAAIDTDGQIEEQLVLAENFLQKGLDCIQGTDKIAQLESTLYGWRGVIYRIRGDLENARTYMKHPKCQFHCLRTVARGKFELALVEYLDNNSDLADALKEEGLHLLGQVNLTQKNSPFWWYCFRAMQDH